MANDTLKLLDTHGFDISTMKYFNVQNLPVLLQPHIMGMVAKKQAMLRNNN